MSLGFKKLGQSIASAVGKGDPYYAIYQELASIQKLDPDSGERKSRLQDVNTKLFELDKAAKAEKYPDGPTLKKIWVLQQFFWSLALRDPKTSPELQQSQWRVIYENIYSPASAHRVWYNDPSTAIQATKPKLLEELEKLHSNAIAGRRRQAAAASAAAFPGEVNQLLKKIGNRVFEESWPLPPTHTPGTKPPGSKFFGGKTRKNRKQARKTRKNAFRRRR